MGKKHRYIVFLRGINVGGHHKVPMADLRMEMEVMGFTDVKTLLNSGNVIFNSKLQNEIDLESQMAHRLTELFGFSIPVMVLSANTLISLIENNPFGDIELTKDLRFNVSFLKDNPTNSISLPFYSKDQSFQILCQIDKSICSVLDLSKTGTIKAMKILEKTYGKDLTTRNWNTVEKIVKLL